MPNFRVGDWVRLQPKFRAQHATAIHYVTARVLTISGGAMTLDFGVHTQNYAYHKSWHHVSYFELAEHHDEFKLKFDFAGHDVDEAIAAATKIATQTGIPVEVVHVET